MGSTIDSDQWEQFLGPMDRASKRTLRFPRFRISSCIICLQVNAHRPDRGAQETSLRWIVAYAHFLDLMQLTYSAPNNGTKGLLKPIMKKPTDHEEEDLKDLPDCMDMSNTTKVLTKCGNGCQFEVGNLDFSTWPAKMPIKNLATLFDQSFY